MVEPEADKANATWSIWREPNWRDPGVKIVWWKYLLGLVRVFIVFFLAAYLSTVFVVSGLWILESDVRTEYDGYIDSIATVMTSSVLIAVSTYAGTVFVLIAIASVIWSRKVGWRRNHTAR